MKLIRMAPALLAGLALSACAKQAPAPSSPEQIRSAPATDALQRALAGTWHLDHQALTQDPALAALPEAERAQALQVLSGLMGGTRLVFEADGALSMRFGEREQRGTWRATGAEDDVLTFEAETQSASGPRTETITARLAGDRLRITGADGKALDLVRAGSPADVKPAPSTLAAPASAPAPTAPASAPAPSGAPAPTGTPPG